MWKALHPNIKIRIGIDFLASMGGSFIFPFMAIYFTRAYNAQIAGALVFINVVVSFLSGMYGGHLTDTFGRRKMILIGEASMIVTSAGILLANSSILHSPLLTYLMMVLTSLAFGLIGPANQAMLVDVSTEDTRAFMYSISYWANNLSLMMGLMIAGWFYDKHFTGLIMALVGINIITFLLSYFFIHETHHVEKETSKNVGLAAVLKNYKEVFKDLRFLLFTIGGIFIMLIEFQRGDYIAVHLAQDFHATNVLGTHLDGVKIVSMLTMVNTAIVVLFTVPITKWINTKSYRTIFIIGLIFFAGGFAIESFSTHFMSLVIGAIVLSFGELMYVPVRQSKLADLMDENKRGAYVAFNGIIYQLGEAAAAGMLMISPFIGRLGMASLVVVSGILAITITLYSLTKVPTHA